ncbi:MAG: hypothetical protein IE933_09490 [Sphingomonadales bacterium]|nr:hypothetical protein [Sphingomonadales bacterium]MBD3772995.1 hypothetical protein [Paracoccaceae bacterium]MBD3814571.1 hypothetical protein [Betaproteobacteria bacterium]
MPERQVLYAFGAVIVQVRKNHPRLHKMQLREFIAVYQCFKIYRSVSNRRKKHESDSVAASHNRISNRESRFACLWVGMPQRAESALQRPAPAGKAASGEAGAMARFGFYLAAKGARHPAGDSH